MPVTRAPELRTERLRLRGHRRSDASQLLAMWQDPVVLRHFGSPPTGAEDCWNRLLRYVGHWAVNGYGLWAVEELESGRFVGDVGLFEGRRGLGKKFDRAPEAGWVLLPEWHGHGYAREAMAAALRWGESEHGWPRTVCMIDPDNSPSFRTAAALGYRPYDRQSYRGKDLSLLERLGPG
jgi:RimJ/RimL family protein N-acetyltransferase